MKIGVLGIAGVGLIGGSVGLAAKARGLAGRVIGIGRSVDHLETARRLGAIDEYRLDLQEGAIACDLLYLATPVQTIIAQIAELSALTPDRELVVTDGGSAKVAIVRAAEQLPSGIRFVGGHPMAGSEQSGVEAASAGLYEGATYVVTPVNSTDAKALEMVSELASGLGAHVVTMDPEEHDRSVAAISHLPHILAGALLKTADTRGDTARALAAGSFRDLTRVADSPAVLWRDICAANREPLLAVISEVKGELDRVEQMLSGCDDDGLERWFSEGRRIHESFQMRRESEP